MAAAVGSFSRRSTLRPASRAASLVAWRWEIVEVGRHGDDRARKLAAQGTLRAIAQHAQDLR